MTKFAKKLLSILLAVIIVFGSAAIGVSGVIDWSLTAKAVNNYSGTAAATYARYWWDTRNNDVWADYDLWGGDCANFVAQSIYNGGIPMTPQWYFHKRTGPNPNGLSTERTESFTMANGLKGHTTEANRSLYRYLISIGGEVIKNPDKSDISVGDVLFYDWSTNGRTPNGLYDHCAICTDIINGIPEIACHYESRTTDYDRLTTNWTLGEQPKNIAVIKLYGTPCVNTMPSYDVYKVTTKSGIALRNDASTSAGKKGVSAGYDFVLHVTETKKVGNDTWGKCKVKGIEGWLRLSGLTRYVTHVESIPVDHKWGDWYVVKKPTCVEKGLEKRNCERCGIEQQRETECGGHKEIKPATCLDASYCAACGAIVSDALGHNYGSWQTVVPATCLEGGQDKHVCTRCGHTEFRDTNPLGHNYQSKVTLPDCITDGETIYRCLRCGDSYTDSSEWSAWTTLEDTSVLSKFPSDVYESRIEYSYSDKYYVDDESTKTTNPIPTGNDYIVKTDTTVGKEFWGYKVEYYCTMDTSGVRYYRDKSINGQYDKYGVNPDYGEHHKSLDVSEADFKKAKTIAPDGFMGTNISPNMPGHNKASQTGYAILYNPQLNYTACAYPIDKIYKDTTVTVYYKSYIKWTEPSVWSTAYVEATPDRRVETRTVYRFKQAALNHDDVFSTITRTCYEDGCTRATCQRCGRTYDTEIVPKANHVTMGEWYRWTPPEINNPDIIIYRRDCKTTPGCDYYELKELRIKKEVVEPTCTAEGYTLVTVYDENGDVVAEYEDGDRVPALGHDMGEYKMIKAPTCTEKGQEEAKCQRNGCKHKEYRDIDPLGHVEVTDPAIAPTCTITGLTEGTHCSRCDSVVVAQQVVPATGHNMGEWTPYDYNPDELICEGMGTDRRYCQNENCDYFEEKYTNGPEHNFVVVRTVDATCTLPGFIQEECSRCGCPNATFTVEPLGHIEGDEYTFYPTCLKDGYEGWDCQREGCDHTETVKVLYATGHDFKEEYHSETCTSGGYYEYTCQNIDRNTDIPCGYYYTDETDALGHDMGEWYVVVPATCETPGVEQRDCIRDDLTETREIPPTDHDYQPTKAEPTCTENGGTVYVCQNDPSHTYTDDIIPALGHDWGEWVEKTPAGCITEGIKERVCKRDPSHVDTQKIPALGHDIVNEEGKAPTCTEDGLSEGAHCTRCTTEITDQEILNALGHDWGEWDIKEPTCEEDGYKKRVCKRDPSHVEEETLEATGHNEEIIPGIAATCLESGLTEGLICTNCKKVLVEQQIIPQLGHDWGEWETVSESSCVAEGKLIRVCKRDASHVEYDSTGPDPHPIVTDEGYSATCTEDGLTEGSHCSSCEKVIVAQEKIPALGHDWGGWTRVEPTCTENGYEMRVCKRDATHVETVVIPATGHVVVTDEAVSATCYDDGLTEGSHCSVCDKVFEEQKVVPALDHDWGAWETMTNPDCIADGSMKRVCKREASHVETASIPALGHTPVIDPAKDATCLESGKTAGSHCSVCDAVIEKQGYIAPLGHDWGEWDIKEPTCTENGYEKRICKRDSSHIEEKTLEATGHSPEALRGKEPTCLDSGLTEGSVCTTCKETLVAQQIIPALDHDWGDWQIVESTCISKGSKIRVCKRDSSHIDEEYVPGPIPHDAVIDEGYSATCTETGLTEGSHCGYCNKVIVAQKVIPALGHDWGEWEIKEPTCEEDGSKDRVCKRDPSHVEHEDLFHEDHTVVIDKAVDATCEESGLTEGSHCSDCGKTLVAQEVIPALDHDWGEWKVITEPGCITNGEKKCVCNRDASHVKTEEISALGHTVVDEDSIPATCLGSGKTSGSHCSVCNATILKQEYIAPLGHDWGEWEIKEPTCEEAGYKKRVCKRDSSHIEEETLPALGHTVETIPAVEPTCLDSGLTEGSYCSVCDKVLVQQQVVPELGHDWGEWEEIDSDCTNDGSRKRVCNRDASHIEEEIISANGHVVVVDEGKEPTCLDSGLTEGSHCSTCKKVIVKQEVIPALGHDWGEWDIKEPTCTENGYEKRVCNRDASHTEGNILYAKGHVPETDTGYEATCEEPGLSNGSHCSVCETVLDAQEVIPALGHDWGEWHSINEPDCLNDGESERICNRDTAHVEKREIPALGHTVVIDPAVAPTCTESGKTAGSHCSVCDGVIEKREMINPLGHEMGEWYVVIPADYGVEGLEQCDCVRGDKSETRPIPALVKNTYTATFVIGDEVIGTVTFEEGAKIIEEPSIPKKDNYIGSWEDYELGNEDIVINGYYEPIDPDKTSELEEEKIAEYENGIAKITLRAQADTKAINILSESTKPVDVVLVLDQSGSMDQPPTKRKDLIKAAETFVDDIYENAIATGADHRVAIVGFAYGNDSQYGGNYVNTEIITTLDGRPVNWNAAKDADFRNALMYIKSNDGSINPLVRDVIDDRHIKAEGATAADLGLGMAADIFANNPVNLEERQRIVLFITDGVPTTWDTDTESRVTSVAKAALTEAEKIKAVSGEGACAAKIYSVGISEEIDPTSDFISTNNNGWSRTEKFDFNRFLHYVSSNYPAAKAMNNSGTGDKTGGFYLAANDTEKLQSIFDGILYSSVYTVTNFDKVTLVDTVSADFTMTMEQEEAFREKLAAEKGLGDNDITITRNEDGTTTVRVDNVKAEKVYDEDGKAYYKAELSFEVTANENALEEGEYATNTEDAGVIIEGGYVEKFDVPTVIISESRNIVVFTINGNVYRIDEGQLGDTITVPESDLAKWNIPDDAVITESYMEIEASEICQDEYTVTWKINDETIVTKHKVGSVIEPVEVPDPSTDLEFAGWSPALRNLMPAKNLVYTATFKTKHTHNFVATTYSGNCEDGIVTYYECACGEKKTETSAPAEHKYEAVISNTNSKVIEQIRCSECGKSSGQSLKYSCAYQTDSGWRTQTVEIDLYQDGIKVQLGEDEKVYIMIPVDESLANKTFVVKRIAENGRKYIVRSKVENGYVVFEADHFSIYSIMVVDPVTGLPYEELTYEQSICALSGHTLESEKVAPTCVSDGYTKQTCTVCGFFTYTDEVPATGHTYTDKTVMPDCTHGGYVEHICESCGHTFRDNEADALGHDYITEVTEPTCTLGGYTMFTCSRCEHCYKGEETEKTGHSFRTTVVAATCTAAGYTLNECEICGVDYMDNHIEALGHEYVDETVESTCTGEGYVTHTCSRCSDTYVDSTSAAKGHSYTATVVAATCTEVGYTVNECSDCGYSYRSDETPAKGHTASGNWIVKDGKHVQLCVDCNEIAISKDAFIGVEGISGNRLAVYYKMSRVLEVTASEGKVVYHSADPSIATVDENGKVTGVNRGSTEITATVEGTDTSVTVKVEVSYAWWQWLIKIFLLGFLWY